MGKRISLNDDELWLINCLLDEVLEDGGSYRWSGKYGKRFVQRLKAKIKFTDLAPTDPPSDPDVLQSAKKPAQGPTGGKP